LLFDVFAGVSSIFGGIFVGVFGGFLIAVELVESFDNDEDGECDDEEIDDILNKITISDMGDGVGTKDVRNIDRKRGEIGTTSEEASDGHNDVIDKRFNNSREGATNSDTDSKIYDAAAIDKFFELLHERTLG